MSKNTLAWKLTIWFFLLSLLPIGVIVLFVRQDVSEEFTNLAKEDTGSWLFPPHARADPALWGSFGPVQ